jgi:hypothetical protein
MSYQEKRTITSMITMALVLGAYCIYAFGKYQAGAVAADDLKFWATTMLIFIGIGVAAGIVIQIVFHILISIAIAVKEKVRDVNCDDKAIERSIEVEMVEDERDKLIDQKSMMVGFAIAGFGFVAGLVSLVLNYSPMVMLNIMFISFSAGSVLEGFVQLYFYRRGIAHG